MQCRSGILLWYFLSGILTVLWLFYEYFRIIMGFLEPFDLRSMRSINMKKILFCDLHIVAVKTYFNLCCRAHFQSISFAPWSQLLDNQLTWIGCRQCAQNTHRESSEAESSQISSTGAHLALSRAAFYLQGS